MTRTERDLAVERMLGAVKDLVEIADNADILDDLREAFREALARPIIFERGDAIHVSVMFRSDGGGVVERHRIAGTSGRMTLTQILAEVTEIAANSTRSLFWELEDSRD